MEQTAAVSMPGHPGATVIVTGVNDGAAANTPVADGPPAFVSPTEGMSESQAAAMRWVDANRATLAKDPNNAWLQRQYRQAVQHALHGAPPPDWLPVEAGDAAKPAAAPAEGKTDADAESGFARVADAMDPQELAHYRNAGVNLGLHPAVSDTMATLAAEFKIPRAVANDLQTVAVQHFGGPDALDSIPVLDDAGLMDMQAKAVAKYGEAEITELSVKARQVLADKGLLQKFDDLGLTKSSLAFDRRALRALIFWGEAAR